MMSDFRFRLATLLKLRQRLRDTRRADLAKAYEADAILQEQTEQVDQELDELRHCVRQTSRLGTVDVEKLVSAKRHEVQLQSARREIEQRQRQLEAEIERRHEALLEADRDTRMLERLREKQQAQHQADQTKRENRQLDEMAQRCRRGEETAERWTS